ncbi:TPA: hypothetical protein I7768_21585 [Vibrio vulnificus]|nr:hypothetical protein [Vibrio vulnificus]
MCLRRNADAFVLRCSLLNWALCKYSNQPISQCLCLRLWMQIKWLTGQSILVNCVQTKRY